MGSGIYHRYLSLFFGYQQARQTSFSGVIGIYSFSVLYTFFAYPLARCKHFVSYVSEVELASALDQEGFLLLGDALMAHIGEIHDELIHS